MVKSRYNGNYIKAFFSKKKALSNSIEYDLFNKKIAVNDNEAVIIFSFKGNKLLFAKGHEKLIGISDEDVDLLKLNSLYTPYFQNFTNEYNDRLLLYLYNNNENIESLDSHMIIKLQNIETPFMLNLKVYNTNKNGNLISIIGRITKIEDLKTSSIIQYSTKADFKPAFLDLINHDLDFLSCISNYNIKIIEQLKKGKTVSQIANGLNISEEKLKINIKKLLKKFELNSNQELIDFAKSNYIIPNQFDVYLKK